MKVQAGQEDGVIQGFAEPKSIIEVANLSDLAALRLSSADVAVLAYSDDRGQFLGVPPGRNGDLIALRSRSARGKLGPWLSFRLKKTGRPRQRTLVDVDRIGLAAVSYGKVRLFNLGTYQIAEPFSRLTFTNTRNRQHASIVLDRRGSFGRREILDAMPGDKLLIRIGKDQRVGALFVPHRRSTAGIQSAPRLSAFAKRAEFDTVCLSGPLFSPMPSPEDVVQGSIQDCHLAAVASAMAQACPTLLLRMFEPRSGSYAVRLFAATRRYVAVKATWVLVSTEMYISPSGRLLYAQTSPLGMRSASTAGIWWPILEKAIATHLGGYDKLDLGGSPDRILEMLLGRPTCHRYVSVTDRDRLWKEMKDWLCSRQPVVATTHPTVHRYSYTGIMDDHAYAVLDYDESESGLRRVLLRDPWGSGSPAFSKSRGQVLIGWDAFVRLFATVCSTAR